MIALLLALVTVAQAAPTSAADAAYARHDYQQAKALYQTAVSANPKDSRAWYRLAVIGVAQGDATEALADLDAFSKASPVPATAYRNDANFERFRTLPGYDAFVASVERRQYPCRFDPAARAMDGWIGSWGVANPNGPGGTSVVDRAFDGCVIVEHWTGQFGERGMSLTSYDATAQRWLQHYVSDNATATDYTGAAKGSSVVFVAPGAITRMTYDFLKDGRVEQRFESSSDGGTTWTITSDLYYTRSSR
ncbi:MAG TPA: tetratricopeptide repeat protein [Candidatus Baltobacteraceae bacterium]|jgi:tetratricopeptide (TPR) repeat protein|nr:tetratricopeptide repeat protein [Candidatus Baltobacteraceae bacterium]